MWFLYEVTNNADRASKMLFPTVNQLRRFKIRATQAADKAAAKKKYHQRKRQVDDMKADYEEWHNKQMLYSQPVTLTNLKCTRSRGIILMCLLVRIDRKLSIQN